MYSGKFQGNQTSQFLWMIAKLQKLNLRNKLDRTVHNGWEYTRLQKNKPAKWHVEISHP